MSVPDPVHDGTRADLRKTLPAVHLFRAILISAAIALSMTGYSMAQGLDGFVSEQVLIGTTVTIVNVILFILLFTELFNAITFTTGSVIKNKDKSLEKAIRKDEEKREEITDKLQELKSEAKKLDNDEDEIQKKISDLELDLEKLKEKGPEYKSKAEQRARDAEIARLKVKLKEIKDKRKKIKDQIDALEKVSREITQDVNNLRHKQIDSWVNDLGDHPNREKIAEYFTKLQEFLREMTPYKNNQKIIDSVQFCVKNGKKPGDIAMEAVYSKVMYDIGNLDNQVSMLRTKKTEFDRLHGEFDNMEQRLAQWRSTYTESVRDLDELKTYIQQIGMQVLGNESRAKFDNRIGEIAKLLAQYFEQKKQVDAERGIENIINEVRRQRTIDLGILNFEALLKDSIALSINILKLLHELVPELSSRTKHIMQALKDGEDVDEYEYPGEIPN